MSCYLVFLIFLYAFAGFQSAWAQAISPVQLHLLTPVASEHEKILCQQKDENGFHIFEQWVMASKPNESSGSTYVWQVLPADKTQQIHLVSEGKKVVVLADHGAIAVIEPVMYWDSHGKEGLGRISVQGDRLKVQVRALASQYPLRIDPSLKWGQWLGGEGVGGNPIVEGVAYNSSNSNIDVGGYLAPVGLANNLTTTSLVMQGNSDGFDNGFVAEVEDGGSPSLVWGQWLGGNGNSIVYGLTTNGGNIYVGGYSAVSTGWETTTFFGSMVGTQGFVVKILDGGTPSLVWNQWLGGNGTDVVYDVQINGSKIYAGGYATTSVGWETVTFQGAETSSGGSSDGFVVEMQDGGSPSLVWGQWLGGKSNSTVYALAVSGSTIVVGGYSDQSTGWETVNFSGIDNGLTEGFVVNIQDGGTPSLAWGQWLGGASNTYIYSVAVNGSNIYAGGFTAESTSWETVAFQGGGGNPYAQEGFVVKMTDGGTPSLGWGEWLGGGILNNNGTSSTYSNEVYALQVNGSNIYVGGYINGTSGMVTTTVYGKNYGAYSGFIANIIDGGTPCLTWLQFLGSNGGNNAIYGFTYNGSTIYAGGYTQYSTGWTTVTFQGLFNGGNSGLLIKMADGGTPSLNWGQVLGAGQGEQGNITTVAANGNTIYVGGYTDQSTGWPNFTFYGPYNGGSQGFVVEMIDGGTPSLNWGQWLGGIDYGVVYDLTYNGSNIYVGGVSNLTTGWPSVPSHNSLISPTSSYLLKILDGGTPCLTWLQWFGGSGNSEVQAVTYSGGNIYTGGWANTGTSLWAVTMQGANAANGREGFAVKIADGGTPCLLWGQWVGGASDTQVEAIDSNGSNIYTGGFSSQSTQWEGVTFTGGFNATGGFISEGFVVEVLDGGTPSLVWGQWLGGVSYTEVLALGHNGSNIYAGGYTQQSTGWTTVTFQGGPNQYADQGFVVKMLDGGTPDLVWGQWLGAGNSNGYGNLVYALAVNGSNIYAAGYINSSINIEPTTLLGKNNGNDEGYVANIIDGGTPCLSWIQWVGGAGTDMVYALGFNGSSLYLGGYSSESTNFETITFQGSYTSDHTMWLVRESVPDATTTSSTFFDTEF